MGAVSSSELSLVWEIEFAAKAQLTGAGPTHIDHIAQTMSYDDMQSWSLFYTTLFDLNKAPMVDVIDPDGLVRSQAVESPDGAVKVTLNGADTHRTLAVHFGLKRSAHLCSTSRLQRTIFLRRSMI